MGVLKDKFSSLKKTIVGTTTSDIDQKLDNAVKDISAYRTNQGRNSYIELIRSLIAKNGSFNIPTGQGGIFSQAVSPASFGQGSRITRYKMYESIVYNINYCHRALNVLVDNILSPDDITKISLEINPDETLEEEETTESKTKYLGEVIKLLKLEDRLPLLVRATLMYGDFFCEIGDERTSLTNRSILAESYENMIIDQFKSGAKENIVCEIEKNKKLKFVIDYSSFYESKDDKPSDKKEDKKFDVRDLRLMFHEPKFVVKLQSALFPVCFGYLVFPQMVINPQATMQDDAINNICKQILSNVAKKIPQVDDQNIDESDLKDLLSYLVKHMDPTKAMNIRFISPDKMIHFMIPSTKYYPYGESIFDSCQFTAKVLIALETALAIQRLSRSTEKRKVMIEVGLPRDAKKAVEALKEEFRKRKVSIDSFGTVDTIPSMITTFEDIYIPQKDGKAFVDIQGFAEGNVDVRNKTDELKFLRDSVVASLGVPASFLNIEENLSNKAALSEENILFARTVIGHQKHFKPYITELIKKILDIVNPEEALTMLDNVDITLPTPKSLQFEREAKYMNDLAGLVEALDRIGIPKEFSIKKYMTSIDWDDVKKYKIEHDIDKNLDPAKKKEEDGALGGMAGFGSPGVSGMSTF